MLKSIYRPSGPSPLKLYPCDSIYSYTNNVIILYMYNSLNLNNILFSNLLYLKIGQYSQLHYTDSLF